MTQTALSISGTGLITGKTSQVEIELQPPGTGIVFQLGETLIPASPEFVVNTDRGVTLGASDGKTLSIVEHFLAACAMSRFGDLRVKVSGAPELPLLDGSALPWVTLLNEAFGPHAGRQQAKPFYLAQPVLFQDEKQPAIQLIAVPAEGLQMTYLVDFQHPDLKQRWYTWASHSGNLVTDIAPARTFGYESELPLLQAKGLGLGVTLENTLGLTDDGGYTSELRFTDEPVRHKILDLIGDLMLCDVPIHRLNAHIIVYWGGHTAHLCFGKRLREALAG